MATHSCWRTRKQPCCYWPKPPDVLASSYGWNDAVCANCCSEQTRIDRLAHHVVSSMS